MVDIKQEKLGRFVRESAWECENVEQHLWQTAPEAALCDAWLSPHRGVSKDKLTPYLRAFRLRRRILR